MKIANKIGIGIGTVTLLLAINTVISFSGINKLSDSVNFISGPAWETADGAMESTIFLQQKMISTQTILSTLDSESASAKKAEQRYNEATQNLKETLPRLSDAGLLAAQQLSQLSNQINAQNSARNLAIDSHHLFLDHHHATMENLDQLVSVMSYVEDIGDGAVEVLENNPNLAMSWLGGLEDKWQAADGAMEARINILSRLYYYQSILNGTPPNEVSDELESSLADLKDSISRLSSTPSFRNETLPTGDFAGRSIVATLNELVETHDRLMTQAIESHTQLEKDKVQFYQAVGKVMGQLEVLEEQGDGTVENEKVNAHDLMITIDSLIIIGAILGIIIAIIAIFITVRSVVNPIQNIVKSMKDISSGEGDLTVQLPVNGDDETAQLSKAFNNFVSKIRHTMLDVANATEQLGQQSQQLATVSSQNLDAANRQQGETDLVATAITEFSQTSEVVASNASHVADANNEASKQTQQGQQVINDMVGRITQLSDDVGRSADVINHLDQDAESIERILDVIRGIAEQTNLLALNAAIEAARAGDQGRGFAVVADEVRELATRSQASTEEINTLIEQLRADSQNAVETMTHSREQATQTMQQTEQVNQTFSAITNAVGQANDLAAQIASAALQQSSVSEEVTRNIVNIKDLSSDNAKGTAHVANTSHELSDLANKLQNLVGSFKL